MAKPLGKIGQMPKKMAVDSLDKIDPHVCQPMTVQAIKSMVMLQGMLDQRMAGTFQVMPGFVNYHPGDPLRMRVIAPWSGEPLDESAWDALAEVLPECEVSAGSLGDDGMFSWVVTLPAEDMTDAAEPIFDGDPQPDPDPAIDHPTHF